MPKVFGTPGPRAIHPSICTSKSLGACSVLAQLLFDRLIAQADDQGRIEDGAAYIRGVCVPMIGTVTVKAIEKALGELAAAEMILRYRADGRDLIQLRGWWTFQSGMRWRYPSRFLPPDDWQDSVKVPGPDGKTPEPNGNIPQSDGNLPPSRADARPPVDRTGPMPDRTYAGPDRAGPDARDPLVLDEDGFERVRQWLAERRAWTDSPKVQTDLARDVDRKGADAVIAAMEAEAAEGAEDAAQFVYGAHKRLFPLGGSRNGSAPKGHTRPAQEVIDAFQRG